ncbi:InlB B-repeat-containing protein [Parabacteroides goldsteinii]|uniref:InlB B-repeat-containing protein n=1 Tax=Parabacteroides goldsteinii TaxID=328812 RepID=UPI00259BBE79|nr:hypothetical protein [Parabacteroides goldsteinii]
MRKRIFLFSVFASMTLGFMSCNDEYVTVPVNDFSPSADFEGIASNPGDDDDGTTNTAIINQPVTIKIALGNKITDGQPIDYSFTYLPSSGEGILTHGENALSPREPYYYQSKVSDDVVNFLYTPKTLGNHKFDIRIKCRNIEKDVNVDFDSEELQFEINIEAQSDKFEIDRPTTYIMHMDEELTGKFNLTARFNTGEGVITIKDSKSGEILTLSEDTPTSVNVGDSEIALTPHTDGETSISFNVTHNGFTQLLILKQTTELPDFEVKAENMSGDNIHASGGMQVEMEINPFEHPQNKEFDIYAEKYANAEAAALAGQKRTYATTYSDLDIIEPIERVFVKRVSSKPTRTTYGTDNEASDIIKEALFVPIAIEGTQTARMVAQSVRYENERFDDIFFNAKESTLKIESTPASGHIIDATINAAHDINRTIYSEGAQHYTLSYKVDGGSCKLQDSKGYYKTAGDAFDIEENSLIKFTPTTLGDITLTLSVTCYNNSGILLESKDIALTYRVSNNPLILTIEPYPTPTQTGVSIPLHLKLSKEGYNNNSFGVTYTQTAGKGVFRNNNSEIKPNSNFTMQRDVLHTYTYTPEVPGIHKLVLSVNVDGVIIPKEIEINVPVHIKASCTPILGGSIKGAGIYDLNTPYSINIETNKGYRFTGLYSGETIVSNQLNYNSTAVEDKTYEARFEEVIFHLTTQVVPEGAGTITGAGDYRYDAPVTLKATANTGYRFTGFSGDFTNNNNTFNFNMPEKDVHVSANFEKIKTAITVTNGNGGHITLNGTTVTSGTSVQYDYGTQLVYTAVPNSDQRVLGWWCDGQQVSTSAQLSVTVGLEAKSYEARFDRNTRNISVVSQNSTLGTVTGTGTPIYGTEHAITANVKTEGYHFTGWYNNGRLVTQANPYRFKVETDLALEARFAINTYTVTCSSSGGATVSGTGTYNHGAQATIKATHSNSSDYKFEYMTINGAEYTSNPTVITVKENTDISIKYAYLINHVSGYADPENNRVVATLTQPSRFGGTQIEMNIEADDYSFSTSATVSIRPDETTGSTSINLPKGKNYKITITNVFGDFYNFKY